MKFHQLLDLLSEAKQNDADVYNAEVAIEGWDDNAYDGLSVQGVRIVKDIETADSRKTVVFIISGDSR